MIFIVLANKPFKKINLDTGKTNHVDQKIKIEKEGPNNKAKPSSGTKPSYLE